MAYPNNELNNGPLNLMPTINADGTETLSSASVNFGFYSLCYGGTNDIVKVPKISGLQYLDIDTYTIYAFIDGTGELHGWTKLTTGGADSSVLAKVLVDGVTIAGDGRNIPLSASASIPDYDPGVEYGRDRIVHATFKGIEGIYRHTVDPKHVWGIIECTHLMPNVSRALNAGEYFYIDGFDHSISQNDGIYRVNPALTSGIAILITATNMHDLQDHITRGNVQIIANKKGEGTAEAWVANKVYKKNELVYLTGDYSRLYYMLLDSYKQTVFSVYDTSYLTWQLLADISPANTPKNQLKPGCMILFVGTTMPEKYLKCDGAELNIADYPELFEELGKKFGGSATTFKLPIADNMIIKVK